MLNFILGPFLGCALDANTYEFPEVPNFPVVKSFCRFRVSTEGFYDRKMGCKQWTRANLSALERLRKKTTFNGLSRGFTKYPKHPTTVNKMTMQPD